MLKKCASMILIAYSIMIPATLSFAHGIKETPKWETINYSDNFVWYNVIYSQKGERIGLEETDRPYYGQDIVITYKTDEKYEGKQAKISIYDGDIDYVFSKDVIVNNYEIIIDAKLLSNRQKLESLNSENDLYYFCIISLPDLIIKSGKVNVNFTLVLDLEIYEHQLGEESNFDIMVESIDDRYSQIHSLLKDGMVYGKHRIQRLIYTDILLNKYYNIIYVLNGKIIYYLGRNMYILDIIDYYDE